MPGLIGFVNSKLIL